MLKLIQITCGLEFKDALKEAANFLGNISLYKKSEVVYEKTVTQSVRTANKKIEGARKIYEQGRPVENTLAERYLREHRGLNSHLSKALRYHPHLKNWSNGKYAPALIVPAKDDQGIVCGIQAIFLDANTANKAELTDPDFKFVNKLSLGKTCLGSLLNQGTKGGKVAFAEGPETALSVIEAHP